MKAIQVTEHGGPEVLTVRELPTPTPGPGQVLVRVAAAGVNFIETYLRSGRYPSQPPFTPGSEGAGEVTALGEGVTSVRLGQRIASTEMAGSYAEYALVPADRVVPVPDGIPEESAAAILHDCHPIRSGETVLVHAAAGGMGLLLTRWATRLGARVIGTTSTEEKAALARKAGAAEVIVGYENVAKTVKDLTGGDGVPAVYDGVGRATFDESLASLRRRGILVLFGYASGPIPPFDISRLQTGGSLFLTRPTLGHFIATPEELSRRAGDVLSLVAAGDLTVNVGNRYPLAEAGRAHEDLESRRTTGKLLLIP
jgi:NADPH2:quinone reductase